MFGITELPRVDGLVVGDFLAKHKSASFSLEGYGFQFANGVTKEPARGRICDRLHGAYGMDVCFVPCARADGESALRWMAQQGHPTRRIDACSAALDELFPVAKPLAKGSVYPADSLEPAVAPLDEDDTDMASPKAKRGGKR